MISSLKGGKLPYYKVVFACTLSIVFTYMFSKNMPRKVGRENVVATNSGDEKMNFVRLKRHRLSQPILFGDNINESSKFSNLKQELLNKISSEKTSGKVSNVSIYLSEFNDDSWMGIQQNDLFDPGSIMKLPILLAYLKRLEVSPSFFDKRIKFDIVTDAMPKQTIVTNHIEKGKTYTVRNLIKAMIIDSDNQANMLLNQNIEPEYVYNVFTDLGMEVPKIQQSSVKMSAIDISKFMRVLYNSSYTTQNLSEFALELLTDTKFNNGMKKGLPDSILIAHKFGERGYRDTTFQEIHETGIIYLPNNTIVLTIMTSGNDQAYQTQLIANITNSIYDWYEAKSTPNLP
ncbi:MAG: serine hydrolase [Bacteroidetes bacterium]|nr:serine hydrolase [Bacteroidota bacterium]